jgi:hypothetical protein
MKEPFPVGTKLIIPNGTCTYTIIAYTFRGNTHLVKVQYLDTGEEATWSANCIEFDIPLTPLLEALL